MTKRTIASAAGLAAVLVAGLALAFAVAFPMEAHAAEQPASPLKVNAAHVLKPASVSDVEVEYEGESFYQGLGVTWVYDLRDLVSNFYYKDDASIDIVSTSGTGAVSYEKTGDYAYFSITALQAGSVTVTCEETWTESDDQNIKQTQTATHLFVINVLGLENTSGEVVKCVAGSSYASGTLTFNISDLPADKNAVDLVSDSKSDGYSRIESVAAGQVALYVYGVGTHTIQLKAYGKDITCVATLRILSLKRTAAVKNTGSIVAYPKQKNTLKVSLTGVKDPNVTWTSTNPRIATVNKNGVVKAKKKGRCYAKAKVDGATLKVLVEVTSKKAYQAVNNGFKDMKTKITYSQPYRMSAKRRDCSSFVSRCYWDPTLGRKIALIGGSGAASWAYNAAAQACWLNDVGKRISWKACSASKLRPGDAIYFETDYAGKDASQWHYIDHTGLYVGNGYILQTGGYGGKGTIGLSAYGSKDKRVKFIGRPCS